MSLQPDTTLAIITLASTIIVALLLHKREMTKANAEMFRAISDRSAALDIETRAEIERLQNDVSKVRSTLQNISSSFVEISREYAILKKQMDRLIDIIGELIGQIEENNIIPLYTMKDIESELIGAKLSQNDVCEACIANIVGINNKPLSMKDD